jgi:predicted RNA-binding protein with TRAM domain
MIAGNELQPTFQGQGNQMNLRRSVTALLGALLLVVPGVVIAGPAHATVTVTRELVDVDFTSATMSSSTITNNATDKTSNLTVFGSPTGLGTSNGLTFVNTTAENTNQYLTGNLGNTAVMSEIVVEFDGRFPDSGCNAGQLNGSMVFGLGDAGGVFIPYNIYRHSGFIGYNTFNGDLYGIALPDTTSFHRYKFVMRPNTFAQNLQEIWVDGVKQDLAQQVSAVAQSPCSVLGPPAQPKETLSGRIFTGGSSSYSDGSFMLMTHPLLPSRWGSSGSLKNIRITTTDTLDEPIAPSAPSVGSVTAGDGQLSVAFTAPSSNGGSAITDYEYSTDNGVTWVSAASTSSPIVITGLSNGTSYNVKLRAINSAGDGTASAAVSATPTASGDGPTAPLIDDVIPGDGQLSIFFAAPSDNGGSTITDYEYSLDGGANWISAASTVSPIVITGLSNGEIYSVKLRAVTSAGAGSASTAVSSTPSEDAGEDNSTPGTLARTGVDVTLAFVGSLVALAAGSVILAASRRKRQI